jgi:hypothetical protein
MNFKEFYLEEQVIENLSSLLHLTEMFEWKKKELSREEFPKYGYYKVKELVSPSDSPNDEFEMDSYYTLDGDYYVGDEKNAKFIFKKMGLTKVQPRIGGPGKVCSIGFNEKEQKWYGWSHRAIVGFKIGDKIFEEGFGNDKTKFIEHGSKTIKTLDDAKQAASNFAKYVS